MDAKHLLDGKLKRGTNVLEYRILCKTKNIFFQRVPKRPTLPSNQSQSVIIWELVIFEDNFSLQMYSMEHIFVVVERARKNFFLKIVVFKLFTNVFKLLRKLFKFVKNSKFVL